MKRKLKAILLICWMLSCVLALAEVDSPALDAAQRMAQGIASMGEPTLEESFAAWTDSRTGGACWLEYYQDEAEAASRLEELAGENACRVLGYVLRLDDGLDEDALADYRAALTQAAGVTYVANRNTKKFHDPTCFSVEQIKDSNRVDFAGEREELIDQGYKPCKRCNP